MSAPNIAEEEKTESQEPTESKVDAVPESTEEVLFEEDGREVGLITTTSKKRTDYQIYINAGEYHVRDLDRARWTLRSRDLIIPEQKPQGGCMYRAVPAPKRKGKKSRLGKGRKAHPQAGTVITSGNRQYVIDKHGSYRRVQE